MLESKDSSISWTNDKVFWWFIERKNDNYKIIISNDKDIEEYNETLYIPYYDGIKTYLLTYIDDIIKQIKREKKINKIIK